MTHSTIVSAPKTIRMLYFVGAGAENRERVDVSCLFGQELGTRGIAIDWYLRSFDAGGPLDRARYYGRPARVCGRSALPGVAGRVMSKIHEWFAIAHFFLTAMRGRHDIVQVRDDFVAGPLGLLAARLRGRRFVFWLSYPFPEARSLDAQEGRSRFPLYSRLAGCQNGVALYRILLPHADHVVVQSEQMKRDVLHGKEDIGRLTAVPMGVPDADLPAPCPPSEDPIVLYLGTLARVRRLPMVIDAFAIVHARMPLARLVIVGAGDQADDRAELEQAVARHGLEDSVRFTGQLPRQDALEWVRRAAVCLSPFYPTYVLRSTSPTKLVEYMAMGKAVVANDHPEQATVIAGSGCGLCTAWDAQEFAEAILALLRDPADRAARGKAGRDWVVRERLYSKIAGDLMRLYRALVPDDAK